MCRIKLNKWLVYIIAGVFLLPSTPAFAQEKSGKTNQEQKQMQEIEPKPSQEEKLQEGQESVQKLRYQVKPKIKSYTYNLKRLLEQIEENIKKVNEKIKEAEIRKRNEEREAKIREHFERGNALYKEGKLKEAKREWQRALEISEDPEMRDYIREAEKRAREEELARKKEEKERQRRLRKQAEFKYREAYSLYKSKNYQKALIKFKELDEFYPDYKRTRHYIQRIPEQIKEAKINSLLERANNFYKKQQYTKAKDIYEEVLGLDSGNRIALRYLKLIPKRMQEKERKELEQKVQSIYNQAYSLYKQKQYTQALEKFKEVKSLLPDYKKTQYYIERISKDIQREKECQELERQRELKKQQEAEKRP